MRVSVLINNFNYAPFLTDCFESLKNQSVKADEVIFYDDGSSDNSIQIAEKYDFVTIIRNENFGQKPGFNQANAIYQAFLKSTGDIICLLDSDDFFDLEKIKIVKQKFESNKDLVLVQNASFEYSNEKIKGITNHAPLKLNKEFYYKKNWTGYFNSTSCFTFRRSYLDKILPIENDGMWRVWPDVRLSRIAPFFGDVMSLEEPLTYYRRHEKNDSSQMNEDFKKTLLNQIDHHEYLNKTLNSFGIKEINYKMSFKYFSFVIKSILPKTIIQLILKIKKNIKR